MKRNVTVGIDILLQRWIENFIMKGEMDRAKEKDDRMASGIHSITSDRIRRWSRENDIWTRTFVIKETNVDWWIGN